MPKVRTLFSHVKPSEQLCGLRDSPPTMGMAGMQDRQEERARAIADSALLFEDARLLVQHSRYASAFRVAILGLEEIGKVILDAWEAVEPLPKPRVRRTSHERKQAAVGSVLLAAFAMREFGLPVGEISDELIEEVGPIFEQSREGRFLRYIGFEMLGTKHVGLFRDPSQANPDGRLPSLEDVESIFDIAKFILDLLLDGDVMQKGLAIYIAILNSYTAFRD